MDNYLLTIDQGTTATKISIYDSNNQTINSVTKPLTQYYPNPGWVEHDPIEIILTIKNGIKEVLEKSGIKPERIIAVGIDNQGETVIPFNKKTGEHLYNAIVWQDSRTSSFCAELKDRYDEKLLTDKTGLFFDPYFSSTKISWLINNVDRVQESVKKGEAIVATSDAWILFKLTGDKAIKTDVTTASRTSAFNINTLQWDEDLLDLFNIPKSVLPEVLSTVSNFGNCDPDICSGISAPIYASCVDQQASLFGHGCLDKGEAKITYGTGGFLFLNIGKKRISLDEKIITTLAAKYDDTVNYAIDGGVYCVGSCINWLIDRLGLMKEAEECDKLAYKLKDNDGVFFVPSLAGLSVPYWQSNLGGSFFGLSLKAKREHFVRAVLEGIAYRFHEIMDIIRNSGFSDIKFFSVDGGVSNSNFLMQFQTDITGIEIKRPEYKELTSLGMFYLTALGAGVINNVKNIKGRLNYEKIFYPVSDEKIKARYKSDFTKWKNAVRQTINWHNSIK